MNTNEFSEQFIDRIDARGVVLLGPSEVGLLVTTFPVIGGGHQCIVLQVDGMIVRLTVRGNAWSAEHLVVAGSGA